MELASNGSSAYELDDIDRGVLAALGQDARNTTAQEVAEQVGVSASTVRNRLSNLEGVGVVKGYRPVFDYARAGLPVRVLFACTVAPDRRAEVAAAVLDVEGVVDVRELLTDRCNLLVDVVTASQDALDEVTDDLRAHNVDVDGADIVIGHHVRPAGPFRSSRSSDHP